MNPTLKANNPSLAKRIFWYGMISFALVMSMWGINGAILVYNLVATDMGWALAAVIFCVIWLVIYTAIRGILVPINRQLALAATTEYLKAIGRYVEERKNKA